MTTLNFAVCVMYCDYNFETELHRYKICRVLQLFETEGLANEAMYILNPFYSYNVEVIPVINLADYD